MADVFKKGLLQRLGMKPAVRFGVYLVTAKLAEAGVWLGPAPTKSFRERLGDDLSLQEVGVLLPVQHAVHFEGVGGGVGE